MRYGLIGSIIFHVLVFGLVIFNFAGEDKTADAPPPPPVSVEVMSPSEFSQRQTGKQDGKSQAPTPIADVKAIEAPALAKKEVEPKPSPKPAEKEALPPPPKAASAPPPPSPPAPQPKPVQQAAVEPVPEKPVEKPVKPIVRKEVEQKPVVKPKPEPKREETEQKRVEPPQKPQQERIFDPNKIASVLQKDGPRDQRTSSSQAMMDTAPTKTPTDRQTAVLDRDPNAGSPGGEYQPKQAWRPASSLQDQAMGLSNARGPVNTGSCADLVQARIEQNWDLPIGALSAENTLVRLRIELNRDGTLLRPPSVLDNSYAPGYAAMADAAVRAAIRGQPYTLPPEQFERCRDMVLRFNPRDMYGG